jgi:hypothetical protein
MASIDFHQKITAHEAKAWIRNCMDAYDAALLGDEEQFIQFITENKPKDFKAPRKSRASKKSSEERAESEYDCQLCDARVWNDALGGQCSRKKLDGGVCCSIHMKESGKNDGCLRNGFVTEDRPTHAYGDETQQMLPWHDVEIPKKTKKTSGGGGKGTRKCSNCGECGHNKKTCPLLKGDTEETVEKKEVEETVDDGWANDTEELSDGEEETVEETEVEEEKKVEKKEKKEKKVEKKEKKVEKVEKKENVEDVISTVRAALIDVVKTVEDTVSVEDDGTGVGFEQIDSPTTEPLSDCANSDLEEDESGDTIVFEGVEYTFDGEEGLVYDDELAEMGTWDGARIEFLNAQVAKLHRVRKLTIKNE